MILNILEKILIFFNYIFFSIIWLLHKIAKIIEFIVCIVLFLAIWESIGMLTQPYQGIILNILIFGSAFSFISLFSLMIWKKEKFNKIIHKFF
ncbi:hypothetical protein A2331_05145 [Candidatus Falkowbacteria bacterium RIFOXYB2_FULL_34_18]|uniref:Uncharacterized protein n=1 Tax=Candidatus Falkowbacteria bacterium RIFOXYD2_FULL_34_120 TaxID=1798007 RepID=A0A1F5TNB6_9BACT|nr:MAG: hypothetical protein A2500_07100 [Candidatus Falkowbacteria bacterium RIFOXYC12_FULL_34_55]OGF28731.1 MAG: hypothetical protein A2331_05145 [Candidatus Falkowbacteria bacterium RIFOXYB2_FULL_34_18]OGF38096.1 MAG: hypothetical protein A2466_04325 [Candidatus Falkowbacteria bacterium RIFOXYC2_FULL_34_220]OGF38350.1 MAG: hypothetical protein A2515_06355 [Candidatus Falkowbacteria bacterium RIFOXYD12_FULL_34_57]OGF40337.1 MAG: hypothetical protein A2531_00615 [Candidatus Falkowbacteria bact